MIADSQIVKAQKVLRKLDATPVKLLRGDGVVCIQVIYENDTYNDLLSVLNSVATEPLRCQVVQEPVDGYHRIKV